MEIVHMSHLWWKNEYALAKWHVEDMIKLNKFGSSLTTFKVIRLQLCNRRNLKILKSQCTINMAIHLTKTSTTPENLTIDYQLNPIHKIIWSMDDIFVVKVIMPENYYQDTWMGGHKFLHHRIEIFNRLKKAYKVEVYSYNTPMIQ